MVAGVNDLDHRGGRCLLLVFEKAFALIRKLLFSKVSNLASSLKRSFEKLIPYLELISLFGRESRQKSLFAILFLLTFLSLHDSCFWQDIYRALANQLLTTNKFRIERFNRASFKIFFEFFSDSFLAFRFFFYDKKYPLISSF